MTDLTSLLMDGIVALLLVATIGFSIRLNNRLSALRSDSARLEQLISGLQVASSRAEDAVAMLKSAAESAGNHLQEVVDQAESLKSDLVFVSEKAEASADRLEAQLKAQREALANNIQPPPQAAPVPPMPASGPIGPIPGMTARPMTPRTPQARASADIVDKSSQSRLSALLKQASSSAAALAAREEAARGEAMPAGPSMQPAPAPVNRSDMAARDAGRPPQSRAERDLLKALQARK